MNLFDQTTSDDHKPIPAGFTLEPQGKNVLVIHHKRTGMGCMNIFLVFFLAFWTVVGSVVSFHAGMAELWFEMIYWGVDIALAILVAYVLFCRKSFRLDPEKVIIETNVLGFKRCRTVSKHSIQRFVQVKDGGVDVEESFPSWGLVVKGDKPATLLFRQPYEKSHWLGQVLAKWACVEFLEAPNEHEFRAEQSVARRRGRPRA